MMVSDETCRELEYATHEYGFDMVVEAKSPFD